MMKRSLTSRELGIMTVLGVALVVLFVYQGIYVPYEERRENLQAQIVRAEARLKKNLRILQKSKASAEKGKKLLETFKQEDSDDQVISAMISEMEAAAKGIPIHISDIKPQKVRKDNSINTFSVSLVLDGALSPIVNFIHVLQTAPHLFQIQELRLEKRSFNSTDLKCYLSLNRLLIQPGFFSFLLK